MDESRLRALMEAVAAGQTTTDDAVARLKDLPFEDLGFAKLDHHRALRQGIPEVIYGAGKTPDHLVEIIGRMKAHGSNVLATRCEAAGVEAVLKAHPDAEYHEAARALTLVSAPVEQRPGFVAVVCAGTSDLPVCEEAVVTCEVQGSRVERVYDVGVAGIHRLLARRETLQQAIALVVVAGMEGALPSAVAGLVSRPVIAVPTSVGYGANFGGVAALLAMLNSCGTGVSVVNIDNGFGAGMLASMIHRLKHEE